VLLSDAIAYAYKQIEKKTEGRLKKGDFILNQYDTKRSIVDIKRYKKIYEAGLKNQSVPEHYVHVLCYVVYDCYMNNKIIPGYKESQMSTMEIIGRLRYPSWLYKVYEACDKQMLEDYRVAFGLINHAKGVQDLGT